MAGRGGGGAFVEETVLNEHRKQRRQEMRSTCSTCERHTPIGGGLFWESVSQSSEAARKAEPCAEKKCRTQSAFVSDVGQPRRREDASEVAPILPALSALPNFRFQG